MQEYLVIPTDYYPAPFIQDLRLINPYTGQREEGHAAMVDTGADYTCLPGVLIARLDLWQRREGIDDDEEWPTWVLRIEHESEGLVFPEVYVSPPPSHVRPDEFILGKDVLNELHIFLRPRDGEHGVLDIYTTSNA